MIIQANSGATGMMARLLSNIRPDFGKVGSRKSPRFVAAIDAVFELQPFSRYRRIRFTTSLPRARSCIARHFPLARASVPW
jgi:hypothetical protein